MARYIDADKAHEGIEAIQTSLESNDDREWRKNKPYYKGLAWARGVIDETPTADVAPRAEVEYWKEQCFNACMNNGCLDKAIVDAAVARKIFEEIEKCMMDSVDVTHTAYKTIGTSTFAILKKKYTEGQK